MAGAGVVAPPRPNACQTALLAIPAMATVAGLAGVVRFLFWAAERGLDVTDEGYYLISARHPEDVVMMVTASHRLLSPLFAAVGWNVPAYRAAGIIITVLSSFVLAAGLDAWRRQLEPAASRSWTYFFTEASAIAMAGLLGSSWLVTSPSYNWIVNWGVSIGAGAVLVTLAIGDASRAASAWLVLLGFSLGAMFFAKIPAAIATGAVFCGVLLAWPSAPFRVRVRWVVTAAAAFLAFAAMYFIVLQSPASWVRMVQLGLWGEATQSTLHGPESFARYYRDWRNEAFPLWWKEFNRVFFVMTGIAAVMLVVPAWRRARTILRVIAWGGIGYAAYVSAIHVRDYPPVLYGYDVTRFFFGWLLFLGPLALVWGKTGTDKSRFAWVLVAGMLFVLPFVAAVGTGNPMHFTMTHVLAPWFALLALILGRLSVPARTRWAVPVGLAVLAGYSAVYLVRGPLEAPYRLLAGVRGQTEDTQVGDPGSFVKLDPELHAFITDVRQAAQANGFKPGDDMLGLFDMPGIVFALGARSPGATWWMSGYPGSRAVRERAIEVAGAERVRHAYILQTELSTDWLKSLASRGVNFPDDYVLAGTFTIPYAWAKHEARLWRPKAR